MDRLNDLAVELDISRRWRGKRRVYSSPLKETRTRKERPRGRQNIR